MDRWAALAAYAGELTDWAIAETRTAWARIDPDAIKASWPRVYGHLLAVHERLTVNTLDAVDLTMAAAAADAGWLFDTDWHRDHPHRPALTATGAPAAAKIAAAPIITLAAIKQTGSTDAGLARGLNALVRIMATEAHDIVRTVTASRLP